MSVQSQMIQKLAAALVAAQKDVRGAKKDSENPHFKSKYADLASVWDACRDALRTQNVAVIQMPGYDGATRCVTMTTRLLHESGEWIESTAGAPIEERTANAQGVGSAITYLRRYGLAAMVGVVTEDDDGNAASRPAKPQRQEPRADQHGEIVLPGTDKNWSGEGGKPLSKASDKALVDCRDYFRGKGKRQDLVDAINDELEQRRSVAGEALGTGGTTQPPLRPSAQSGREEKRAEPATSQTVGKGHITNPGATDTGRPDPTMPQAIQDADEHDALLASVELAFRSAKALKVGEGGISEGKLALMEARWKEWGAVPTSAQCSMMLGQLERAAKEKAKATATG